MKNQKLTYILLPLVALIWGVIFYKIFWANNSTDYSNYRPNKDKTEKSVELVDDTNYKTLSLNYQDPFLKDNPAEKKMEKKDEPENNRVLNRVVRWPNIKYKGMVSSDKNKSALGMLVIGNKDYLVRQGKEFGNVKVLQIWTDSIQLKYETDLKSFYLFRN